MYIVYNNIIIAYIIICNHSDTIVEEREHWVVFSLTNGKLRLYTTAVQLED